MYEIPIWRVVNHGGYVFSGSFERWLTENNINGKLVIKNDNNYSLRGFGDNQRKFYIRFDNDDDALLYKLLCQSE